MTPEQMTVAEDDGSVMVGMARGMRRGVGVIDLKSGRDKMVDLGMPTVTGFRQAGRAKGLCVCGELEYVIRAVYMTTALGEPGRRLVQPESAPAAWMAVAPKAVSWKRAGFTVEGLLYLPPQAASGKVPVVVNVHGGPRGQFTDTYSR